MSVKATTIAATTHTKASSVGVVTSAGGVSLGFANVSEVTIALSLVALIVSTIAFLYDHHHTEEEEKESGMAMWTTFAMYLIFGTPALPAGYNFTTTHYPDPTAGMVAGFLCSWIVVAVVKAIKLRAIREVKERKL